MTSRAYLGVVIEQTGVAYTAWMDFVTERQAQPRCDTLAAAKAMVKAARS